MASHGRCSSPSTGDSDSSGRRMSSRLSSPMSAAMSNPLTSSSRSACIARGRLGGDGRWRKAALGVRGPCCREMSSLRLRSRLTLEHSTTPLTLGRLGAELGADPTALYRHYRSRDELLRDLADRVFIGPNASFEHQDDWRQSLKQFALDAAHRVPAEACARRRGRRPIHRRPQRTALDRDPSRGAPARRLRRGHGRRADTRRRFTVRQPRGDDGDT